jgi:hypothetical protein
MLIDIGPATLVVNGEREGRPYFFDGSNLAERVGAILADLRDCLPVLRQKAFKIRKTAYLPAVARKMVDAVKAIDEAELTPMAAVAGAVADELKEYLRGEGLEFISVNNGGDIALYNARGRPITIGIGDIRKGGAAPYVLKAARLVDFGVATSGFGGRSFSLGIADMVSVVAGSAPLADAAATYLGNRTTVDDPAVKRRKAGDIDPSTDIPDELVTVSVGELGSESAAEALARGKAAADLLKREGRITDALLFLRGHMVTTIRGGGSINLEVAHGNQEDRDGGRGHPL